MSVQRTDARAAKDQRFNLRVSGRQEQLIRQAAAASDRTMTDFILESVVEHAERILADRRWFLASEEQWAELQRLLDAPLPSTSKFQELGRRESPFADE
ncbi:DUF1778 domain-containing protein [Blastococcus sp. LR1]|uniref:type II toxin-antitoxin system TacA family antitoxin n=1 Tax=Blastococcus sp. LR1 TaxID=2877000 RepID=UPI001CC92712|nr:DUF1778 domain-containing protein [Blastococcus sp. LR1]MCA0144818.1 DUF1778 domain-containing protein [Blastococcus sp. LR1]